MQGLRTPSWKGACRAYGLHPGRGHAGLTDSILEGGMQGLQTPSWKGACRAYRLHPERGHAGLTDSILKGGMQGLQTPSWKGLQTPSWKGACMQQANIMLMRKLLYVRTSKWVGLYPCYIHSTLEIYPRMKERTAVFGLPKVTRIHGFHLIKRGWCYCCISCACGAWPWPLFPCTLPL